MLKTKSAIKNQTQKNKIRPNHNNPVLSSLCLKFLFSAVAVATFNEAASLLSDSKVAAKAALIFDKIP